MNITKKLGKVMFIDPEKIYRICKSIIKFKVNS